MTPMEQPLYPKLSSIYNKILQLSLAIILMVMMMSFWVFSQQEQQQQIQQHADEFSQYYLAQAASNVMFHLSNNREQLQVYVDDLAKQPLVADVHVYDNKGAIIAKSQAAKSIKTLYGIAANTSDHSQNITPYVQQLTSTQFSGHLRLSLHRPLLVDKLLADSRNQFDINRVLMAIAGIIGFLLTRGFNRFSRQGFRPPKQSS